MFTAPMSAARRGHPAMAYQHMHIESQVQGSATPHRLVSMLFDGYFEAIAQAKGALAAKNIEAKCKAVSKASAIVEEGLRASLDLRAGGKVAQDLNDLYTYVTQRLTYANLKNDLAALDECAKLLKPVQDAWNAIAPDSGVPN